MRIAALTQVFLGISTLLLYVPVSLGAAHQAMAVTLWSIVLFLGHSLRRLKPVNTTLAKVEAVGIQKFFKKLLQ